VQHDIGRGCGQCRGGIGAHQHIANLGARRAQQCRQRLANLGRVDIDRTDDREATARRR
jgi:hypothetical protein